MDVEAIGQGALFVAGLVNYQTIPSFLPSTGNDARLGWALNLFGDHFAKELEPQQGSMQMLDGFGL